MEPQTFDRFNVVSIYFANRAIRFVVDAGKTRFTAVLVTFLLQFHCLAGRNISRPLHGDLNRTNRFRLFRIGSDSPVSRGALLGLTRSFVIPFPFQRFRATDPAEMRRGKAKTFKEIER